MTLALLTSFEDISANGDPWEQYYFPALSSLQVLCCDPRHAVRHHAMNFLQRSLLSPELSEHCPNAFQMSFPQVHVLARRCGCYFLGSCSDDGIETLPHCARGPGRSRKVMRALLCRYHILTIQQIIFPLLTKLLKPMTLVGEDKQVASMNIEETRVRATTLLSRIFLQHLARLVVLPTFHTNFWFQMLKYFEMYRQTDHGGFLVRGERSAAV